MLHILRHSWDLDTIFILSDIDHTLSISSVFCKIAFSLGQGSSWCSKMATNSWNHSWFLYHWPQNFFKSVMRPVLWQKSRECSDLQYLRFETELDGVNPQRLCMGFFRKSPLLSLGVWGHVVEQATPMIFNSTKMPLSSHKNPSFFSASTFLKCHSFIYTVPHTCHHYCMIFWYIFLYMWTQTQRIIILFYKCLMENSVKWRGLMCFYICTYNFSCSTQWALMVGG